MDTEIIYVCNSTNNKNVRRNELKILRKYEENLYFEFGETEMNIKKRYYNDVETLNKDYQKLEELKKEQGQKKEIKKEPKEIKEDFLKSKEKSVTEKLFKK